MAFNFEDKLDEKLCRNKFESSEVQNKIEKGWETLEESFWNWIKWNETGKCSKDNIEEVHERKSVFHQFMFAGVL